MYATLGEIRIFAGNFAPQGWAFCNGDLLSISEYEALFMIVGATYGGDGQTTFALPDLRGRAPVHQGGSLMLGQQATPAAAGGQQQSPAWLGLNFIIALQGIFPTPS